MAEVVGQAGVMVVLDQVGMGEEVGLVNRGSFVSVVRMVWEEVLVGEPEMVLLFQLGGRDHVWVGVEDQELVAVPFVGTLDGAVSGLARLVTMRQQVANLPQVVVWYVRLGW
jgi:hypothetical protein